MLLHVKHRDHRCRTARRLVTQCEWAADSRCSTSASAASSVCTSCAPETAYFPARTKVGTLVMPRSRAAARSAATSATRSSESRNRRASAASRPISPARVASASRDPTSTPSVEVRLVERLHHLGRPALVGRPGDQPVRLEGVGDHRAVVVEPQPVGRRDLGHVVDHLPGALRAAELAGQRLHQRAGLRHRRRVELERSVADRHLALVAGEGLIQAALADVAPRADDVRVDLDLHDRWQPRGQPSCSRICRLRRPRIAVPPRIRSGLIACASPIRW